MPRLISILLILTLLVGLVPASAAQKESLPAGMVVWLIGKDSPAEKAGIEDNDLILSCDGQPVVFYTSLRLICGKALKDGKKSVKVTLRRDDKEITLDLPVTRDPEVSIQPPMTHGIRERFYTIMDPNTEADDLELARSVAELARSAEKDGHLQSAEWLYWVVARMDSSDQTKSQAAKRLMEVSTRIGDELGKADGLFYLGVLASASDDRKAALEHYQAAAAIYEKLTPASEKHIEALNGAFSTALAADDRKSALEYSRKLLKVYEDAYPDSPEIAVILRNMGELCTDENWKTAVEYFERALKRLSPDSVDVALVLTHIGLLYSNVEMHKEAYDYKMRAVEAAERAEPDGLALAICLGNLSASEQELGDLESAEKHARRALEIHEKLKPGSMNVAISLNILGSIMEKRGDLDAAEANYRRAVEIQTMLSPDSLDLADSMDNLAILLGDRGRIEEAEKYCLAALRIRERLAPDSLDVALTLNNLGSIFITRGDMEKAEGYMRRALEIRERLAPDTPSTATALSNLGYLISNMGRLGEAFDYLQRALSLLEKIVPDSHHMVATLNNLGAVSSYRGDYKSALDYYQRALTLQERFAPDSPNTATFLSNIACVMGIQKDRTAERSYLERALAILEKTAPDSMHTVAVLINLGSSDTAMGDLASAEGHLKRAYQIAERIAPIGPEVATILNNLGTLYSEMDDTESARRYLLDALAVYEKTSDTASSAQALGNLAALALKQEDYEQAGKYAEKAVELSRGSEDTPRLASSLKALALAQAAVRDYESAVPTLIEAVEAFEQFSFSDSDARERVLEGVDGSIYELLLVLLIKLNRPEEALKYLERAKSKAVVDSLNVRSIRTGNEELTALLKKHADLQAQIKAQQQAVDKEKAKPEGERNLAKIEQITKLLAQTKAEFYQVINQIRKDYGPEYSALVQVEPTEFSRIQKELPPDAVVIEYFPAQDKLYIFVVTRDSFKVKEHSIARSAIDGSVQEIREAMDAWKSGLGADTPPEALVSLYDSLIKPVEEEITANKTVIFVPSGSLCYLPFAALAQKDEDGKLRYLVEGDQQFVTLTQMGLLGKLLENDRASSEGRSVGAIAFGNPTGIRPALPNAESEVNTISGIYPDSKAYTGDDATEWRVKLQAQYGNIVHLATHATLRNSNPNESYIALMPCEDDDGRLTVGEIFGLPLEGTSLVVLSACQTAIAEEDPGRELSSLAQAFAIAGAPSVIASLWSVSDESTEQLMSALYQALAQGKSKAAALQEAQKGLLVEGKYAHPFFWASFTFLGAWE